MILSDSFSLLDSAAKKLLSINDLYKSSLNKKEVPTALKVEISDFLNNLRSALEFSMFYIFETYCVHNYPAKEQQKRLDNVKFPVKKTKKAFDECINVAFKGLATERPDIIKIIERCQSFKGVHWLSSLAFLNNKNKHKRFTPQKRVVSHREFKIGGVTIINPTFKGNLGGDISINGTEINLDENGIPLTNHPNLKTEIWIDYIFTDLNISVIETLNKILIGVTNILKSLEESLV